MNEQPFKSESKLIRQLFADSNSWYKIPAFQHPYRWMDDQVSQLWEDLWTSFGQHEDSSPRIYFLGAIIVSAPKNEDIYFDVIDGQQRLTSLMILFAVIRDHYPNINKKSTSKTAIKIKDLHRAIDNGDPEDSPRLVIDTRLIPDEGAITCFSDFVSRHDATCENYACPTKNELNGDNPKHNYIRTVQLFREELQKLPLTTISEFINFVFNQVKVIRIECESLDFAMELFQVINTRGMNLRTSDLIKSFLLIKINPKNLQDNALLRQSNHFITEWRRIEEDAQEVDSNMDEMLILYSYYELVESPGKDFYLYNNLKKNFVVKKSKPSDVIANIGRFVANYKIHIANSDDITIHALSYIPWKNLWKSILLSALQEKYHERQDSYQKLTKQILRFYYLHWIAGNTMSKVKKVSFEVIKSIKNREPIEKIEAKLNAHLKEHHVVKKSLEYLNSSMAGKESWCKPLLFSVNYTLTDGPSAFISNDSKFQLEHVLPVGFKNKRGWTHISDKTADTYLHSLGNLTLLSGPKNVEASNKPFAEKIAYYTGEVGSQRNASMFYTTQYITSNTGWDKSTIKEQREWFLTKAAKLLGIQKEMKKSLKENKNPSLPK